MSNVPCNGVHKLKKVFDIEVSIMSFIREHLKDEYISRRNLKLGYIALNI